ncbi:uncharacterized protein LOC129773296 [Toxorhynchites rutilus septentrionalis]|uniref:uncharacterized protein LOC129773296 n=1 Tax=Toxorhynchites rutilus septentrionalis TaxID=329112 RepID=UPI002479BFC0|nr:uncharacterized protein LOC129773296 [Toxorhynchites rutilus septentrionalis]
MFGLAAFRIFYIWNSFWRGCTYLRIQFDRSIKNTKAEQMVSILALCLALLFHTGFKILVFMDPAAKESCGCSLNLNLRSILFLSSVFMYLSTTKIFPRRYRKVPLVAQGVVEFFIFLIAIEVAMIAIWCRLEVLLFKIFDCMAGSTESFLYNRIAGNNLAEFLVTLCSMVTFTLTAIGTGYAETTSGLCYAMFDKLDMMLKRLQKPTTATLPLNSEPNEIVRVTRQSRSRSRRRRSNTPANFYEPWQTTSVRMNERCICTSSERFTYALQNKCVEKIVALRKTLEYTRYANQMQRSI